MDALNFRKRGIEKLMRVMAAPNRWESRKPTKMPRLLDIMSPEDALAVLREGHVLSPTEALETVRHIIAHDHRKVGSFMMRLKGPLDGLRLHDARLLATELTGVLPFEEALRVTRGTLHKVLLTSLISVATGENALAQLLGIERTSPERVGDVRIVTPEGRLAYIVERKTVDDLVMSWGDGRYADQARRLKAVKEESGCTVVYLIEGDVVHSQHRVWGCMMAMQNYRGFTVLQASSVVQSAQMILFLAEKAATPSDQPRPAAPPPAVQSLSMRPGDVMTPDRFLRHTLQLIPGISATRAHDIQAQMGCHSVEGFVQVLRHNTKNLADVQSGTSRRRLGERQAQRVRDAYL